MSIVTKIQEQFLVPGPLVVTRKSMGKWALLIDHWTTALSKMLGFKIEYLFVHVISY